MTCRARSSRSFTNLSEDRQPRAAVPIVEHNRKDLETLARLFSKLQEVWCR